MAKLFSLAVDDVPLALEGETLHVQDDEAIQGEIDLHGAAMENGHAEAGGNGFFDRAIVAEFEPALNFRPLPAEKFFHREARAGSDFALDKDLLRQTADRDAPGFDQRMRRRCDDNKIFGKKWLRHVGDSLGRSPHKDEVDLVLQKPMPERRTVCHFQGHRDPRMSLTKQAQDGRQDIGARGADCRKGDPSSFQPLKFLHHYPGIVAALVHPLRIREQRATRLGQDDTAASFFEEGCADRLLQLPDLDRHAGLAEVQLFGRARVTQTTVDREKDS